MKSRKHQNSCALGVRLQNTLDQVAAIRVVSARRFNSGCIVDYTEAIQFDGLSAFRPCGRDLVEFFNSTGWALHGQMTVIRKHWPTSRY